MKTRNQSKAMRLARLRELLELKPRRVTELAEYFGTSRRTIERDLTDLSELVTLQRDGPEYFIDTPLDVLNPVEALAVHSATRLLVHHAQINEQNYRTALEKLARSLPEPARSSVHRSVEELADKSSVNSRHLDQVAQAWFEQQVLRFDYLSLGSTTGKKRPQELEVYFFEISRTNLAAYVLGYERSWHRAIRVYKLDRMSNLQVDRSAAGRYEIPADFDPHEFLSGAWGIVVGEPIEVSLRFQPQVAQQLRELPPHNLVIGEADADGSVPVLARAGTGPDGIPHDLLAWVRGWGAAVEVVGPPRIREHMRSELRAALNHYD